MIVRRLIAKDLYLQRWLIAGATVAGGLSLVLSSSGAGNAGDGGAVSRGPNLGFLLFITTIITFGIFVAMFGVFKEHQEKSRLFVLSLPVSPAQYLRAKLWAALLAFLAPWTLFTAGVVAALGLGGGAAGSIPFFVALMGCFLVNFCILLAVVVITSSEAASIVGILVTNVLVTLFLMRVGSLPGVAAANGGAVAVWTPTILALLAIEAAVVLLALGLAFYLPSRQSDFV